MTRRVIAIAISLCVAPAAWAQIPPLYIPFDGVVLDEAGSPRTGETTLVLSLYEDSEDGVPVWVEVQPVVLGPDGSYDILLGGASGGVPVDPFVNGSARWLGVAADGLPEGQRALLVSGPYAAKAADADTIGGLAASSFVLSTDAGGATSDSYGVTFGLGGDEKSGGTINGLDTTTDNLYVTNRVGIGTTNPIRQLHLKDSPQSNPLVIDVQANQHAGAWFRENGASKWQIYNETGSDSLQMYAYAAKQRVFTVTSTGYVGIGTVSPLRQLHLKGSPQSNPLVIDVGPGRHSGLWLREDGNSKWQLYNDTFTNDYRMYSYGKPGIVLSLEDVTGNLGLGTVSPQAKLHVSGTGGSLLQLESSSSAAQIRLANSSNSNGYIQYSGGNLRFFANSSSQPTLTLSGGSPGNVGIGTASPSSMLHVAGNVQVDGNIAAKYQDVAEWVVVAAPIAAGSVVVIDTAAHNQVVPSTAGYDTGVAGAVSAQPGLVLGVAGDNKVLVAQSGRVKVKADAAFGPIVAGDILVTSPTPGHAMRSEPVDLGPVQIHRPGTVLGKALEPLAEGRGEILVLLTLQ